MPVPGEEIFLVVGRQTAAGAGATGLTDADFILETRLDGAETSLVTTVTEQETYGVAPNEWTDYLMSVTLGNSVGDFFLRALAASGTDLLSPDIFLTEVTSYTVDTLAALMLTQQGQPAVTSAADDTIGDIVDGDTYTSAVLTVPLAKLTPLGVSSLTALTAEAAAMATPGGTSYPLVCTVIDAGALTFTIGWAGGVSQPFPALTTEPSKQWYIDVQFIKTGSPNKIATTNRYTFSQVWQRETRTS